LFDEDELLPISALEHLVFCERQCALIHLERLWDENNATVEGKHLHERSHDAGTESRGGVRAARGLLLRSLRLGLSGKTDVVEFHLLADGEPEASGAALPGVSGRWRPFPVEFKRGRLRHERSYEVQLCAQALCLEEMLSVSVPDGALFYGKTARRQPVTFDEELRSGTEAAAARLHELFSAGVTPKAVFVKNKCRQCSLFERCVPEVSDGKARVSGYLKRATSVDESPQPLMGEGKGVGV
jgi:CRISPR-associated exonuclease Cas4